MFYLHRIVVYSRFDIDRSFGLKVLLTQDSGFINGLC